MEKQIGIKQTRNKLISSAVTILLILSVCICLYVVVQVLSNGHVSIGGYSCFRVITGSMEPAISVGELILTEATDISDVRIGDIISHRSESPDMLGEIITHRVVDKITDENGNIRLITKGDANLSMDGYFVTSQNFIGKVVWISGDSFFSDVVSFLTGKFGFLACIAFPALVIATIILRDNVKAMKRDIEQAVKVLEEPAKDKNEEAIISEANAAGPDKSEINDEEYDQLCARIRAELIEELKHSDDPEQR